jgi:hypothetical protein
MNQNLKQLGATAFSIIAVATAQAALIATYDFTGGEGSTPASVNGVTFGAFSRGADLTSTATSGAFGSHNWTQTSSASLASSVSFVITPNVAAGAFTLSGITFDFTRGSSGPKQAEVQISYGATTLTDPTWKFINGGSPNSGTSFPIDLSASPIDTTSPITVRFLGWDRANNNANNTLAFDNVKIDGVAPVPEPVHYALGAFALLFAGARAGRHYLARRRAA